MEAIKKTHIKCTGNQLTLTLPETFKAEEVDVLIWASNEETPRPATNRSEDLFLWPDMTDDELLLINEKRQHLNAWKGISYYKTNTQ